MKKVFPFEPNKTVLFELVSYGIALMLATFLTSNFLEGIGLFGMYVTTFVSLSVLIAIAVSLFPLFKPEHYEDVTADSAEGYLQKGRKKLSREDVKKIFIINYKEGRQTWQIFRISGRRSIGVDTRSYPEADKLNSMLAKIFPGAKIQKVNARSPFSTIIVLAVLYMIALLVIGALI